MKRILQTLAKIIPIALLATVFMNLTTVITSANNYEDTTFTFYFFGSQTSTYASEGREKMDYTSSYMYCDSAYEPYVSGPLKYNALVHGSSSETGSYADCYYNGNHSTTYTFYQGDAKYMTNYVKEAGKSWARIRVIKNGMQATFSGLWSPDSI